MSDRSFDPPILVKHGGYLIQEVACLADAMDALNDWPAADRDLMHEVVWRACSLALDGQRPVEVARKAFADFARKKGILEDPASIVSLPKTAPKDIGDATR